MLKRKYGDRAEWKRVIKRQYTQTFLNIEKFKGYVTLLHVQKVSEPLEVSYEKKQVCIVDDGYIWLQHFPIYEKHSLTTMFNAKGEVVQWYIDITEKNGIENNIPFLDDLFLDIVVLPSGEIIQKDAEELEVALANGWIDQAQYNMAWEEADKINHQLLNNEFDLLELAKIHKEMLLNRVEIE